MRYSKTFLIFVLVLVAGAFYSLRVFSKDKTIDNKKAVETVLIAPEKYKQTFSESVKSAEVFYDLYGKGKSNMAAGNYREAIKFFNESLKHVGIIIEKDMVYGKLAEIYRFQGNLEQELKYMEAVLATIPKDAPPSKLRDQDYQRVAELRQLLAAKEKQNGVQ